MSNHGEKLRIIALEAQKFPVKSKERRRALAKLIRGIKQSGELSGADKEALDRTFFAISHQIDEYQETKDVIDWAKQLLLQNIDPIVETN